MDILEKALEKSEQVEQVEQASEAEPVEVGLEQALDKFEQVDDIREAEEKVANAEFKPDRKQSGASEKRLVNIDWHKLAKEGYLSQELDLPVLVDEYRTIKRPILYNAFGRGAEGIERANLILVTSSLPGEGKTFNAVNLALSIANERDKKVLLIDADVAKPSIAKRFGIPESPGLIEYLENDELDFSDVSLKTDLPGLQIIPAGKRHAFSTELLSSNKMVGLIDELSQRYADRIVIFDSPPLLAATQAEVLASLVGQVIFVIAAETTKQSAVQSAVKKLDGSDVVLAVLNKATQGFNVDYYGYGAYGH